MFGRQVLAQCNDIFGAQGILFLFADMIDQALALRVRQISQASSHFCQCGILASHCTVFVEAIDRHLHQSASLRLVEVGQWSQPLDDLRKGLSVTAIRRRLEGGGEIEFQVGWRNQVAKQWREQVDVLGWHLGGQRRRQTAHTYDRLGPLAILLRDRFVPLHDPLQDI